MNNLQNKSAKKELSLLDKLYERILRQIKKAMSLYSQDSSFFVAA